VKELVRGERKWERKMIRKRIFGIFGNFCEKCDND
jgi:hypothetical protein